LDVYRAFHCIAIAFVEFEVYSGCGIRRIVMSVPIAIRISSIRIIRGTIITIHMSGFEFLVPFITGISISTGTGIIGVSWTLLTSCYVLSYGITIQ